MLRKVFLMAAGLAISCSPVLADPAKSEPQAATSAAAPAPATIIAKAEEGTAAAKAETPAEAPAAATGATPSTQAPAAEAKPADTANPVEAAKPAPPPEPTLTVQIDLASQRLTASENGVVKYTFPISSGTASHPTPRGTFRPQWTAKMWYSRKYDNAPMPHAVFINGGVAIHATYATGMLGRPASHGCIRLSPTNAKTFYHLVHKHGLKMTKVSVYGTPKWGSPMVASRKQHPRYAAVQPTSSWDWFGSSSTPTYKYPPNAYKQGAMGKKRKPAQVYYYTNGNQVYYVKAKPGQRIARGGKKYYYNGYGYGYSSY